jgi:hypothetical protein
VVLHIATFRWKDEVDDDDVAGLTSALHAMADGIPEILSYVAQPNLHLRPGGSDYGVAAVLPDRAAVDAYLDHPQHLAVYERFLGRMIAERSAVQLSIEEGTLR